MQKVQRWSQPFCTWTKARVRSFSPSIRCGVAALHLHDVGDRHARSVAGLPAFRPQLFLVAQDPVDFRHGGEHLRIGLGGAAGDDDAGVRIFRAGLRIAWRAWRVASAVTAQVLKTMASDRPAASAWPRMTSDS